MSSCEERSTDEHAPKKGAVKPIAFGKSDVGRKREHNEDSFCLDADLGLYIVADGMGGHAAGEVASAKAVEIIGGHLRENSGRWSQYQTQPTVELRDQILSLVEEAVQKACGEIYRMAQEDKQRHGMGTTLSLMLLIGNEAFIGHVGDSRIYLLREGLVHQLTVDHTLINEQLKRGVISKEEAATARYKNVITRAVGIQERVRVDTLHLDVLPADRFVLCSDGLHGYLKAGELEKITADCEAAQVPDRLIQLANQRGGKDNISVVFLEMPPGDEESSREARQRLDTMRNAPLFKYLSYRELVTLVNLAYIRSARAGERIIEEGVVGDELFLIVTGSARVLKGDQTIARLGQGSHFGEMALIDNAPRSASVEAGEATRLLVIGRKPFYDYIRKDTTAGLKLLWSFLQILTLRLRTADERLREAQEELAVQQVQPDWILPDD